MQEGLSVLPLSTLKVGPLRKGAPDKCALPVPEKHFYRWRPGVNTKKYPYEQTDLIHPHSLPLFSTYFS